MIIRHCTSRTLKASPLRNRRSVRPADGMQRGTHPGGVPHQWHGATHSGSMSLHHLITGGARYARTLGYGAVTALRSYWWYDCMNHSIQRQGEQVAISRRTLFVCRVLREIE
jgi:hypothetical protein